MPANAVHDFAQTVSRVLTEWWFPGQRHVSFDEATYDLRIDGKPRRDNGKGVRAITHAAFKVALLMFCRERGLPHPGFLMLDTPLLTYRDPLDSAAGPLSADEQAIKSTSLKDYFFAHLSSLGALGQIIVVETWNCPPASPKWRMSRRSRAIRQMAAPVCWRGGRVAPLPRRERNPCVRGALGRAFSGAAFPSVLLGPPNPAMCEGLRPGPLWVLCHE